MSQLFLFSLSPSFSSSFFSPLLVCSLFFLLLCPLPPPLPLLPSSFLLSSLLSFFVLISTCSGRLKNSHPKSSPPPSQSSFSVPSLSSSLWCVPLSLPTYQSSLCILSTVAIILQKSRLSSLPSLPVAVLIVNQC